MSRMNHTLDMGHLIMTFSSFLKCKRKKHINWTLQKLGIYEMLLVLDLILSLQLRGAPQWDLSSAYNKVNVNQAAHVT